MDIISAVTRQTERQIENINRLTAELTEAIKGVIGVLPEKDRAEAVESFLAGIRQNLVKTAPTSGKKRGRRKGAKTAKKKGRKPGRPSKRGRKTKKNEAAQAEVAEQ